MTRQHAIRLAEQWADGGVCTLREGEHKEYHALCLAALKEQESGRCKNCNNQQGNCFQNGSSSWISTTDAVPDEGVKVLGYNAETGNYCVGNYSKMFDKWRAPGSPIVTHWMHLPAAPEEESTHA